MKVFLLIKYVDISAIAPHGIEFMGIFSSEEKARAICLQNKDYCLMTFVMDEPLPDETQEAVEGKDFIYIQP